jgi:type II secretory pathway pseudopilin PulG
MNRTFLIALTLALSLGLMTIVSTGISPSYGQQNQSSNTTSTQQNQTTEIGSASEIENMTAGNIPVIGNETDIESQNDTSITEGLQKEQLTTDTNTTNNQTESGGNQTQTTANQTESGGNQTQTTANQTESGGNQTQKGPLEQIGEAISGIFGGGNQSN